MVPLRCFLLVAILLSTAVEGSPLKKTDDLKHIELILDSVPKDDRNAFLRYHLKHGFESKQRQVVNFPKKMDSLTDEQSVQLYEYYMKNPKVPEGGSAKTNRRVVCFEGIGCIDLDDTGVHPM